MKPSEQPPCTYKDKTTNKQFNMIKSNPTAWRADQVSTDMVRTGPRGLIFWNGRYVDVSAYPVCGHNTRSNQDTCTDVALLPISGHNQVPSYRF